MAVAIRLARHGSKKKPFYRIVAVDRRSARDGRFIEQLGTYDPHQNPEKLVLQQEKIDKWLGVGAEPSSTVATLLKRNKAVPVEAATTA